MAAALCLCGPSLFAQDDNGGGPAGPGGPPPDGRAESAGGFNPAQFQQHMLSLSRKNLNVTNDEEWSVIQPLIQKVMDARRDADMGMMGPGGPGGPGGRGGSGQQAGAEQKALQKALDDKAPAEQIKDALARFRAARKNKQAALEAARDNLKNVLTPTQEARAVLMGLLQ